MSQGGRPDSRVNLGCKGLISRRVGTLFSTPRGVQIRQSPPINPEREIEKEREIKRDKERGSEREREGTKKERERLSSGSQNVKMPPKN